MNKNSDSKNAMHKTGTLTFYETAKPTKTKPRYFLAKCRKSINHAKTHGFIFHEFHLPLNAVYGHDAQGNYVYTHIRYYDEKNPDALVLYRRNALTLEWERHVEDNATTKKINDYLAQNNLTYSDCHAVKTSDRKERRRAEREKWDCQKPSLVQPKKPILPHRGKRYPSSKTVISIYPDGQIKTYKA